MIEVEYRGRNKALRCESIQYMYDIGQVLRISNLPSDCQIVIDLDTRKYQILTLR